MNIDHVLSDRNIIIMLRVFQLIALSIFTYVFIDFYFQLLHMGVPITPLLALVSLLLLLPGIGATAYFEWVIRLIKRKDLGLLTRLIRLIKHKRKRK